MEDTSQLSKEISQIETRYRTGMEQLASLEEQYSAFIEEDMPLSPVFGRRMAEDLNTVERRLGLETLSNESVLTYSLRRGGDFKERSTSIAGRLLRATTDSLSKLIDGSGRKRLELAWRDLREIDNEAASGGTLDHPKLRQWLSVNGQVVRNVGSVADNDFGLLTTIMMNRVDASARTIYAVEAALNPLRGIREDRLSERLAVFLKSMSEIKTVFELAGSDAMHHCYLGGLKLVRYVPPSNSKVKGHFFSNMVERIFDRLDKARRTEVAYNSHPTSEDVEPVKAGDVKVLSVHQMEQLMNTVEDLIGFGDLVKKAISRTKGTGARDIRSDAIKILDAYDNANIYIEPDTRREIDVALQFLNHDLTQHLELLPGILIIALRTIDALTLYVRASAEAHKQS